MKKVATVAVAAVLAATAAGTLAGCGDQSHTIRVFLLANAHESEFYDAYFEKMEQQLADWGYPGYTIDYDGEQEGPYYQALDADINGGDTPDIFYVRPNELMQYKEKIANLQSFADEYGFTDDTSVQIADLNDIYPTALNMYRFNPETSELGNPEDDLYAFPKDLSSQQLGYNKTLLSKYETQIKAQNLKMPWEMNFDEENYSWEQFKTMCKAVADAIAANNDANTYSCDVPPIEILARSYGVESLVDLSGGRQNGITADPSQGALYEAIKFQADFINCGAGNYEYATYANFSAGRVCFYGAVGSWEIADYDSLIGKGQWDVMPWPTKDGSTDWEGLITSAGYVVSKECAESGEKGEAAMRLALSFMSPATQRELVESEQISLPLRMSQAESYLDPLKDGTYSPASRSVYLDVISGDHGFFPAKYSTYDSVWMDELNTALENIWGNDTNHAGANDRFNATDWATVASRMQQQYDNKKNR